MPDLIEMMMAQQAQRRAERDPLRQAMLMAQLLDRKQQMVYEAADRAYLEQSRPLQLGALKDQEAEREREKRQRTTREMFAKNIQMIDPNTMDDQTAFEINSAIEQNQASGVFDQQEAAGWKERFPLGFMGRPKEQQFDLGVELAMKGLLPASSLSPEQRQTMAAKREQALGPLVAPSNPIQEAANTKMAGELEDWNRTTGLVNDWIKKGGSIETLMQYPEADRYAMAERRKMTKQLEDKMAGGMDPKLGRLISEANAMADDLGKSIDPEKMGMDRYKQVSSSEIKDMINKKKDELGINVFLGFDKPVYDSQGNVIDAEDELQKYKDRLMMFPVSDSKNQMIARGTAGGDMAAFWVPKTKADEEYIDNIWKQRNRLMDTASKLILKAMGSEDQPAPVQPPPTAAVSEFGGPWAGGQGSGAPAAAAPGGSFEQPAEVAASQGGAMMFRDSMVGMVKQGLVSMEDAELMLSDKAQRARFKREWGVTDEDINATLKEIVNPGP